MPASFVAPEHHLSCGFMSLVFLTPISPKLASYENHTVAEQKNETLD